MQASKFLSLLLRHNPGEIGLELSPEGWARIADLVRLTEGRPVAFTRELIGELVRTSDKSRFVLSDDGERVRANQGHSIAVDLDLMSRQPPDVLFHGTATPFLESILAEGLVKGSRLHVHLSADAETARKVGERHGKPVILRVGAARLHRAGHRFFVSENGVWLIESVPAAFLTVE